MFPRCDIISSHTKSCLENHRYVIYGGVAKEKKYMPKIYTKYARGSDFPQHAVCCFDIFLALMIQLVNVTLQLHKQDVFKPVNPQSKLLQEVDLQQNSFTEV